MEFLSCVNCYIWNAFPFEFLFFFILTLWCKKVSVWLCFLLAVNTHTIQKWKFSLNEARSGKKEKNSPWLRCKNSRHVKHSNLNKSLVVPTDVMFDWALFVCEMFLQILSSLNPSMPWYVFNKASSGCQTILQIILELYINPDYFWVRDLCWVMMNIFSSKYVSQHARVDWL